MAIYYQHYADGYFAWKEEGYGSLPNNATYVPCTEVEGYIPRWNGESWDQVENHKGKQGFIGKIPHTIEEYGPLPEGWSETPPPPTPEEERAIMLSQFTNVIQRRLDTFAQTRGYDNALSAASYATSTDEKFRAEGQYIVEARDATWAAAYVILDDVLAEKRPIPTEEELLAEMPELVWP